MSAAAPDRAAAGIQAAPRPARKIGHRCAALLEVHAGGQELTALVEDVRTIGIAPDATAARMSRLPQSRRELATLRQAGKRFRLADHTKFGHTARFLVGPSSEAEMIITGAGAAEETVAPSQRLGIEVVRV